MHELIEEKKQSIKKKENLKKCNSFLE